MRLPANQKTFLDVPYGLATPFDASSLRIGHCSVIFHCYVCCRKKSETPAADVNEECSPCAHPSTGTSSHPADQRTMHANTARQGVLAPNAVPSNNTDSTMGSHAYLAQLPLQQSPSAASKGVSHNYTGQYRDTAYAYYPGKQDSSSVADSNGTGSMAASLTPSNSQTSPRQNNLLTTSFQYSAERELRLDQTSRSHRRYSPTSASFSVTRTQPADNVNASNSQHFRFNSVDSGSRVHGVPVDSTSPVNSHTAWSPTASGLQTKPGRSSASYSYVVPVVKHTPCYNTSTQTDGGGGRDIAVSSATNISVKDEESFVRARPESLINNSNQKSQSQSALNIHSTSDGQAQTERHTLFEPSRTVSQAEHRIRHIPETIPEMSHLKHDKQTGESLASPQDFSLNDDVLAKISEWSPSQTDMLRKLSQAFYNKPQHVGGETPTQAEMKTNSSTELSKTSHQIKVHSVHFAGVQGEKPSRHDKSDSGFCSREESQDQGMWHGGQLNQVSVQSDDGQETSPFERRSKVQMSMRKAYGICDDDDTARDHTLNLLKAGKAASMTQLPVDTSKSTKSSTISDSKVHKKRGLFDKFRNHPKHVDKDNRGVADASDVASDSGKAVNKDSSSGALRRTTSEQLRPQKSKEKKLKKHRNSDPKEMHKKGSKTFDPVVLDDAQVSRNIHEQKNSSNPEQKPAVAHQSAAEVQSRRLPSSADSVFGDEGLLLHVSHNVSHSRSASAGSEETRHPHHLSVMGKTNKRLSSSSIDTSVPPGLNLRTPPSPSRPSQSALLKSVSLPRDVTPPYALQTQLECSLDETNTEQQSAGQQQDMQTTPSKPPRVQEVYYAFYLLYC